MKIKLTKKISLGWLIMSQTLWAYAGPKLYKSEGVAKRYSRGGPVREVFMLVEKHEVSARVWDAGEWSDEVKRDWEEQTGQPADQMPTDF